MKSLAKMVRLGLPDYGETIDLMLSDGDRVVVELTISGTHAGDMYGVPATGKHISFRDVTILKLRDGKIIEQRGLTDFLSIFQQVGVTQLPSHG